LSEGRKVRKYTQKRKWTYKGGGGQVRTSGGPGRPAGTLGRSGAQETGGGCRGRERRTVTKKEATKTRIEDQKYGSF